jgi:hypothetical protein
MGNLFAEGPSGLSGSTGIAARHATHVNLSLVKPDWRESGFGSLDRPFEALPNLCERGNENRQSTFLWLPLLLMTPLKIPR